MDRVKNIKFDICDGLKNITMADSRGKVEIFPGMTVALRIKNILIHVKTESMTENKSLFVGKVLELGTGIDEGTLAVGDTVSFTIENIAYLS